MSLNKSQYSKRKVIIIDSDRDVLLIRPIRIARTLVRNEYEVEFLMWDKTGSRPKIEYIEGCKVLNFHLKPLSVKMRGLIPGYVLWWFYVILSLFRKNADLYHSENLYNLIPVIPVKILKRKKIIYDILDFVADSSNWSGLIRKFLSCLENFCLKFADGVIIVDEHRKKQINMSNVKNLEIVMNCPGDLMNKLDVQKDKNKFIIYYGGWIMETRGLRQLCEAIEDIEDVKLVLAGAGADEKKFMPIFKTRGNIEFVGLISDIESLEWTYKADVIFAFYDPKIPINRLASPNKLFDAMMCGTPVLANSEALPVAESINKEKCGLLVPYGDIQGIRSAIEWLKDNPEAGIEMGQNGRRAFEREYNWDIMEKRLINLYKKVLVSA